MQGAGQQAAFSSSHSFASGAFSAAALALFSCPASAASAIDDTANKLTANSIKGNKIQFVFITDTLS